MDRITADIIERYKKEAEEVARSQEHLPVLTVFSKGKRKVEVVGLSSERQNFGLAVKSVLRAYKAEAYLLLVEGSIRGKTQDVLVLTYCEKAGESEQWMSRLEGEIPNRTAGQWEPIKSRGPSTVMDW